MVDDQLKSKYVAELAHDDYDEIPQTIHDFIAQVPQSTFLRFSSVQEIANNELFKIYQAEILGGGDGNATIQALNVIDSRSNPDHSHTDIKLCIDILGSDVGKQLLLYTMTHLADQRLFDGLSPCTTLSLCHTNQQVASIDDVRQNVNPCSIM